MQTRARKIGWLASVALTAWCATATAATFAARVGPPNFEFRAAPGERIRETLTLQNAGDQTATYVIRSADWTLNANGGVEIRPESAGLAPDSCRPWVRLERPRVRLPPEGHRRYRFEVVVPPDTPDRGCRFAILVAPAPEETETLEIEDITVPLVGRIAVIVYVTVGEAKPKLVYRSAQLKPRGDHHVVTVSLFNAGDAHARPSGILRARDARGKSYELMAVPFPVLPGEARAIEFLGDPAVTPDDSRFPPLVPPVQIRGEVEWDAGRLRIDDTIESSPAADAP